ncbi:MAG TPA: TonB-dependent receptor [Bryobacteraceae bacterium]|nr:TonB-dependent receptor [Bryobacteraceae bacterium]
MHWSVFGCFLLSASLIFAQSDRGTITGTVTDPAGAVVANAQVQARNVDTGAIYPTTTTATGNYTLAQLPVGTYELTVAAMGFKKYVRQNLGVQVAQVLKVDAPLQLGAATEAVTVSAEASLLKTETGDISSNVDVQTLDQLPMLGTGAANAGSSGIRNPNNVTFLVPGTYYAPNANVKVNGAPTNSQAFRVEGMDATNQLINFAPAETQPSVDSVQEVAIQTSNYAPEYGQAGGGVYNVTMKSGTNQFHGSAYDYFVNEALNAATPFTGYPFTSSVPGTPLSKPRARRNDYGFTVGGPVIIPKVYDGHDKTFFFFNFEQFRETDRINNVPQTVPIPAYRLGDFSETIPALKNKVLDTDPLGRPIYYAGIYDPQTARPVKGQTVTDPFLGNVIPMNRLDPVALKVQQQIPQPTSAGLINNFLPSYPSVRHTTIPGLKIDQNIGDKQKLSFYWSFTHTDSQYSPIYGNSDGLPDIISDARGTFIHSHIERLNYDYTIAPTVLLHIGAGYQENDFFDDAPILNFNAAKTYGLVGATISRNTPVFGGLCPTFGSVTTCSAAGGMRDMGPPGQGHSYLEKPEGIASLTWVKGNHTFKFGTDIFFVAVPDIPYTDTNGNYGFSANETAPPYLIGPTGQQSLTGGTAGFPYASFLLGLVDSVSIAPPSESRQFQSHVGVYAQDSWKATRKLTLDYGLRWDYGTYATEEYGRSVNFSANVANPNAGNRLGGTIFEGSGPGHCNCSFASNYPLAFGPRIGIAYQINDKTVLRAGWGLIYNQTTYGGLPTAASNTVTSIGQGLPVMTLAGGIPPAYIVPYPTFSPGIFPSAPGQIYQPRGGIDVMDPQAGRPARQNQWSVGIQREFARNLVAQVSYVGNRGVWWPGSGLVNINAITPAILSSVGLSLNNPADLALLRTPLAQQSRFGLPYAGFPMFATVAQSLRPYPQFGTITDFNAPLGKTWYDSLQATLTKRLSFGLTGNIAFTWQKSLAEGVSEGGQPAVFNNVLSDPSSAKSFSSLDQPLEVVISAQYTIPTFSSHKVLSLVASGWYLGTLLNYSSGLPIPTPTATVPLNNEIFQQTLFDRVPGQPLYNVDINCHCFDPSKTFVLNPKAWVNPAPGDFSTSAEFYNDFRYQRRPQENMNVGRDFKIKERYSLNIRLEFTNIFNRTYLNNPSVTSPLIPQSTSNGLASGGWGYVDTALRGTSFYQPRQGTIIARFLF